VAATRIEGRRKKIPTVAKETDSAIKLTIANGLYESLANYPRRNVDSRRAYRGS
jgi:hypothetical protein